ncbi:MAG: VRR-NUC domain-containing protein, partial [Gammaproteobacteria bacterium]|nr:VRR-NUC domain-containing protein [Gammaproteobacteria bacterium]
MFAIPNGGDRHPVVAAKLKAEGVKRGVPDVCLPVVRGGYHGLYIELKKPKDSTPAGKPTEEQIEWLAALGDQGYFAALCVGWDAARKTIVDYLGMSDA